MAPAAEPRRERAPLPRGPPGPRLRVALHPRGRGGLEEEVAVVGGDGKVHEAMLPGGEVKKKKEEERRLPPAAQLLRHRLLRPRQPALLLLLLLNLSARQHRLVQLSIPTYDRHL